MSIRELHRRFVASSGVTGGAVLGAMVGAAIVVLTWNAASLRNDDVRWGVVAVPFVAVVVGAALPVVRRLASAPGLVSGVLVASTAAIYLCVPETSDQMPLVAFVVCFLLCVELWARQLLPIGLHALAAAVVLWSGVYGATGRPSALIGALFAMWPIVIVPAAALVVRRLAVIALRARLVVMAVACAAVLIVARAGAVRSSPGRALRWVMAAMLVSLLIALLVGAFTRRPATVPEDERLIAASGTLPR